MTEVALSILSAVLVALVVWIVQTMRNDLNASRAELRQHIHMIRGDLQTCLTKIAVLEERERIAALLEQHRD